MIIDKNKLREKLIKALEEQGFSQSFDDKETYKKVQQKARIEQIKLHSKVLKENIKKVKRYMRDGSEIRVEDIDLELREVRPNSLEETIYRWWNLIWWSIPYQPAYGRQMRFVLWDKTHDAPFGLICLQSPVLRMAVRDEYLDIPKEELDYWINKSMNAHRVGALPPYNDLIGGKMVALALVSNEIREAYKRKYKNYKTLLKQREIESDLLFITTTSAFGKSSIYNRLKYNDEVVAISLGYTKGYGTFHIPEAIYKEMIELLKEEGFNTDRCYGNGPSRKLRLIRLALKTLGFSNSYTNHGIKREFYLFPLVKNLKEVIHNQESPIWYDRPLQELFEYWKRRWGIPRASRTDKWKAFKKEEFFQKIEKIFEY